MYYWKFTDNVVLGLQEMLPKSCYKDDHFKWKLCCDNYSKCTL